MFCIFFKAGIVIMPAFWYNSTIYRGMFYNGEVEIW